jgi:Xaa-Pro dipeptidase
MLNADQAVRGKYVDIERIRRTVDEGPYDAVVVMSPENVPYYSGFFNLDLRTIPERVHFVVWPRGGEPAFVVTERRQAALQPGETFITDVRTYQGEGDDSVRALADVLRERGAATGLVGIEARNLPAFHLQALQARLPQLRVADAFGLLESVRLIKTPAETELLTQLATWTSQAIDAAWAAAQPGDTERAIAARMQYELLQRGVDEIAFAVFGSGERTGRFHGHATEHPVTDGMLLTTDFGGRKDGYYSDLARTAVMGKATPQQRDVHARLTEIKQRVVHSIQPGKRASEVAREARRAYAEHGLEFRWAIVGHSIGLGVHESPQIYPWVDEPILPGMVMMIELGYNQYPADSFHIEDLIVVTEQGAEYRADLGRHGELWELGR